MTNQNHILHIQYPVGQGGLHLGIIGDVAYIYDCGCFRGSKANWQDVFNDLEKQISNCNKLYIYISHLHTDHYNKLIDLLHLHNVIKIKDKKIFIPASSKIEKIMLLSEFDGTEQEYLNYYNFITRPHLDNVDVRIEELSKDDAKQISIYNEYILYPFVTSIKDEHIDLFRQKINDNKKDPDDLLREMSSATKQKEIRKIFLDSFGEKRVTNGIMMCLYCGPDNPKQLWPCIIPPICYYMYGAWMHTGDADLRLKGYLSDFLNHYGSLINNVRFMQIPHHGSKNSHDMWLRNIFPLMGLHVLFYFTHQRNGNAKLYLLDLKLHKYQLFTVTDNPLTKITI